MTVAIGQISRKVVGIATSCHQQRHDRHERAEDEGEDEERAQRRQQRPEQDAGAVALVLAGGGAQCVEPRHLDRGSADGDAGERGLRQPGLRLPLVDAALGRDVDEGERRAAVVGDERPVAGRGIGGGPRLRQRGLDLRESRVELLADAGRVDGRALRERHDGDERRDVAAVAVDRGELLVRLEALAARHVELLRERAARRPDRREGGDRDGEPETEHEPLVVEDETGEGVHGVSFQGFVRCTSDRTRTVYDAVKGR